MRDSSNGKTRDSKPLDVGSIPTSRVLLYKEFKRIRILILRTGFQLPSLPLLGGARFRRGIKVLSVDGTNKQTQTKLLHFRGLLYLLWYRTLTN